MDGPPGSGNEAAAARLEFARELRRLRKDAGLTQPALARRMGYVREYVTLAESGRTLPSEEFARRAAAALSAPELLELHQRAAETKEAGRKAPVLPGIHIGRSPQHAPLDFATLVQLVELWQITRERVSDQGPDDMRRRQFLAELAALGFIPRRQMVDLMRAEPWERLAWVLREPATLDPAVLARLEAEIADYRRQYALVPSGRLLGQTLSRLNDVTQLFAQAPKDDVLPQLYSLAGQTAGLAGWLSFDLHDHESADRYYMVALDAAGRMADHWLEAYILGNLSFLLMYDNKLQEAVTTLERAYGLALSGSSQMVQAWISAVLAEAYSLVGNELACLRALDQAEEHARAIQPDDPAADIFDTARLGGYRGACLIRLSRPGEAEPVLRTALGSMRPELARFQSNVLTDLAAALLDLGDLEGSCQTALKSAKVVTVIRPAVGSQRMRQLRGRYEPWRNHPAVKELDEQLWLL